MREITRFGILCVGLLLFVCPAHAVFVTCALSPRQPIPAQGDGKAAMQPVTFFIQASGKVKDVDLILDIDHTDVSDLQITLTNPKGMSLLLKNPWEPRWRNPRPNMHLTHFDDEAALHLDPDLPPYTGRFKPQQDSYLYLFDSYICHGPWTLNIYDAYYENTGILNYCELRIQTSVFPEPSSLLFLVSGTCLIKSRRRKSDE